MDEVKFKRALEFAQSIRTSILEIGPTIQVGPSQEGSSSIESGPLANLESKSNLSSRQRDELNHYLEELGPYRKGPFSFFGQPVASHWNSDAKWQHCLPFLKEDSSITDGDVLDLGCNNGYYLLRLHQIKTGGRLIGMDPAPSFFQQFRFLQEMLSMEHPIRKIRFVPVAHDALKSNPNACNESGWSSVHAGAELPEDVNINRTSARDFGKSTAGTEKPYNASGLWSGGEKPGDVNIRQTSAQDSDTAPATADLSGLSFDAILCWGVIYHRTDPIDLLRTIHGSLKTGGVLYLESMAISEDPAAPYPRAIFPPGKYAGARGIWHVPDAGTLKNYLHRSGFRQIEILKQWDYSAELNADTGLPVLEEFLDADRPGFLKDGLPAPIRILIRARR